MVGKVLNIRDVVSEDQLGCWIANEYLRWDTLRQEKIDSWKEVRQYVYATDTTQTTNSKLPWTNKTTIPKLCQIRDNLFANYMASIFPKRKWLLWEASEKNANSKAKRDAIVNYMSYVIDQPIFKNEVAKLIMDYIDYGNAIVTADWIDDTNQLDERTQVGYVGPIPRRINPLDIVFNPIAPSFTKSPKIIRSLVSLGEVKEILQRESKPEGEEGWVAMWSYLKGVREQVTNFVGNLTVQDQYLRMDGFGNFQDYLKGDTCELLTFYGDAYDAHSDTFHRNHVIVVVDRHKVIINRPNESYFGTAPVFHSGWRSRQDNLWAMGPLDNLIGLQYRLDHVENLKADVFDLIAYPTVKIKGMVDDFTWGPMEKIHVGDDGDVELLVPPFQVLDANQEIGYLTQMMEEMAGSPKEAMGFRTPGEKTAYEVQRLENAASRIFQSKITQFEEQILEPLLNAMLELARRKIGKTSFRVFDDEYKASTFMTITPEDIAGGGRIKPIAARHFAETAERIQNLNNFYGSHAGQDEGIKMHFSGIQQAKMFEQLLDLQDFEIVTPYVRLSEQADAERFMRAQEEQVNMETATATGLNDDYDMDPQEQGAIANAQAAPPMG